MHTLKHGKAAITYGHVIGLPMLTLFDVFVYSYIMCRQATTEDLQRVHSLAHIQKVSQYNDDNYLQEAMQEEEGYHTYVCSGTKEAATWSAGCGLSMVDAVMTNQVGLISLRDLI